MNRGHEQEALRQQMLLRALWRDARPGVVEGWLRDAPAQRRRGLQAYQAHAGALAERALAAAFPTVHQLVGDESFGALARALWSAQAPERGDIATWGAALPAFIEADAQLAAEDYLADVARLDWAWHDAGHAADDASSLVGLERLAEVDPGELWPRWCHGCALVVSRHPVVTIWLAHRRDDDDRFEPVREAFAAGRGEVAIVWRSGFEPKVAELAPQDLAFSAALMRGCSLAQALSEAGADFNFEPWLVTALQQGWLGELCLQPWKDLR
jgi:hypothetical protein